MEENDSRMDVKKKKSLINCRLNQGLLYKPDQNKKDDTDSIDDEHDEGNKKYIAALN